MAHDPAPGAVRAIRDDLLAAGDSQIRRVLAVVDQTTDPAINQMLLDPLRLRLAIIKPERPIRFTRLLFMPFDPVIVPAPSWRLGDPAVPRTALSPMARIVLTGLGDLAGTIDRIIVGQPTTSVEAIARAGESLWPAAAAILAEAEAPGDWDETGLPLAAFKPLALGIAAVLRMAPRLRLLGRDADIGALPADEPAIALLPRDIAEAPPEGCAMIVRLILARLPHLVPMLKRVVSASQPDADKQLLRQAIAQGVEAAMVTMEAPAGFAGDIGQASLGDAGNQARRLLMLFREIEQDDSFAKHRPRLKAIREKLDEACQTRFAEGVRDGIAAPLEALAGPIDRDGQLRLEDCARHLRSLESVARRFGGAESYDRMLLEALAVASEAAEDGTLTPVRQIRLVELLAGPEAAEALYRHQAAAKV